MQNNILSTQKMLQHACPLRLICAMP